MSTEAAMSTEERVLTALRCEQPDTVPVFIYLNPYVESWYTREPSYSDVLKACEMYADVIYDWYFPSGFFHTVAQVATESRQLPDGLIKPKTLRRGELCEHIRHTPAGPITMITKADWRGSGTIKRWITVSRRRR